ncbi:hypothetical protein GCM10028803_40130 [Larkinella knui]|uniref:Uncharacterized protein n=1 Tax=Larkinella knui TaxID=2025310 RepID=A0A3P1CEV8_9BACT|nr:hypothetical protein [Larkinella knui]RRB11852.1 hypothetical protein EHT87_25645 [Larkinella knui]
METLKNSIADQYQLENCHAENKRWSVTLTGYEQEIDQLMVLLDDVLEQYNHQNLRQRAIDYHQNLNRLKVWFNRLRSDLICNRSTCDSVHQLPCGEPRFGLYATIPAQFAGLSDEFARIKAGCYQFLSVVVQLNLF